jgi:hypothetical protein
MLININNIIININNIIIWFMADLQSAHVVRGCCLADGRLVGGDLYNIIINNTNNIIQILSMLILFV